jgi:hypothetical protein
MTFKSGISKCFAPTTNIGIPDPNESEKKYGRGRFQTCPYTM